MFHLQPLLNIYMFGIGTKLAIWALRNKKIIEVVSIYGIVSSMANPFETRLMKLTMDFKIAKCEFYLVKKVLVHGRYQSDAE